MSEYLDQLLEAARTGSDELFFNGSPEHACDILTALFRTTKRETCFVTRRLEPSVFGRSEVVDAASELLRSGKSMKILFDEDPDECISSTHPFIQAIRSSNRLEIRQISALALANMPYHFTVSDGHAYRYEPDKMKLEAVACMNDPKHGDNFQGIFDSLWMNATVKSLPKVAADC